MDGLLTAVKTTHAPKDLQNIKEAPKNVAVVAPTTILSPKDALDALKSQPDIDALRNVLIYLDPQSPNPDDFSIATPGPLQSQIIHTLVNSTLLDYWRTLSEGDTSGADVQAFCRCLRNIGAIRAISARLKALIAEPSQNASTTANGSGHGQEQISDLIDVLLTILEGNKTCLGIWEGTSHVVDTSMKRKLLWREYVTLIGSGALLSTCAQAEDILKSSKGARHETWLSRGSDYSRWIGENIAIMICSSDDSDSDTSSAAAQLCEKALSLGYRDHVVSELHHGLSMGDEMNAKKLSSWLRKLQKREQERFLTSTLHLLSSKWLDAPLSQQQLDTSSTVSAAAGLLRILHDGNEYARRYLVEWLASPSGHGGNSSVAVLRATVSALASDEDSMQTIVEKGLSLFGDKLYIKHSPILHQERLAQIIALSCGYVHRDQPMALLMLARSSTNMHGVSNRIAADSTRARFLGMTIGVAISELVDKPEARMRFDFESVEEEDAKWYRQLMRTEDKVGSPRDLKAASGGNHDKANERAPRKSPSNRTPRIEEEPWVPLSKGKTKNKSKGPIIEEVGPKIMEVVDSESGDDNDLKPYAKPDSDPEDEEDDPTIVKRNKITAPVYIRDLITGLRSHEDYDKHVLALQTSPSLIRRKSHFGKEVTDHIDDLTSCLLNLQDHYDLPNFSELRSQALTALLLAQPATIAPFYIRQYFNGDYSLQQRTAILQAIGLGARELAGFKDIPGGRIEDTTPTFPSKGLPPHLHAIYAANQTDPVKQLTKSMEQTMISPMAQQALDKATGPNILKVTHQSSRITNPQKPRTQRILHNPLSKIVDSSFIYPLVGLLQSLSLGNNNTTTNDVAPQFTIHLLPTYLNTLALLLNSSGSSTPSLPSITSELLSLILSLRTHALQHSPILSAHLFLYLTVLETNLDAPDGDRRLVSQHSKGFLEMRQWVIDLFERMEGAGGGGGEGGGFLGSGSSGKCKNGAEGGTGGEEERIKMLTAAIIVRCNELVQKWHRLMLGDMVGF